MDTLTHATHYRPMTAADKLRTLVDRMTARRRAGKVAFVVVDAVTGDPYPVTTPYGRRGPLWSLGYHTGEDHACPVGSLALATSFGKVVAVGNAWGESYGLQVVIRTASGDYDYAHNHLSSATVDVGDHVEPGTVLGHTGQTGHAFGPHTHFEARPAGGRFGSDVHPIRVKQRKGVST